MSIFQNLGLVDGTMSVCDLEGPRQTLKLPASEEPGRLAGKLSISSSCAQAARAESIAEALGEKWPQRICRRTVVQGAATSAQNG